MKMVEMPKPKEVIPVMCDKCGDLRAISADILNLNNAAMLEIPCMSCGDGRMIIPTERANPVSIPTIYTN